MKITADNSTKVLMAVCLIAFSIILSIATIRIFKESQQIQKTREIPIGIAYTIELDDTTIYVIDPETGVIIHTENYNSGSELSKAILKDNQ